MSYLVPCSQVRAVGIISSLLLGQGVMLVFKRTLTNDLWSTNVSTLHAWFVPTVLKRTLGVGKTSFSLVYLLNYSLNCEKGNPTSNRPPLRVFMSVHVTQLMMW